MIVAKQSSVTYDGKWLNLPGKRPQTIYIFSKSHCPQTLSFSLQAKTKFKLTILLCRITAGWRTISLIETDLGEDLRRHFTHKTHRPITDSNSRRGGSIIHHLITQNTLVLLACYTAPVYPISGPDCAHLVHGCDWLAGSSKCQWRFGWPKRGGCLPLFSCRLPVCWNNGGFDERETMTVS